MAEQKEWTERDKRINRILYGIAIAWWIVGFIVLYVFFSPARRLYRDSKQYYQEHEIEYIEKSYKQQQNE